MKYLAMILALLSAVPASGADRIKYVPTQLKMTFKYMKARTDTLLTQERVFNKAQGTGQIFVFEDHPLTEKLPIKLHRRESSLKSSLGRTLSYGFYNTTSLRVVYNNAGYSVKVDAQNTYGDHDNVTGPITGSEADRYLPAQGQTADQRGVAYCDVPINVVGPITTDPWIEHEVGILMSNTTTFTHISPGAFLTCHWTLSPVYDLSISLEKSIMNIEGAVGGSRSYTNRVVLSGNGGPARVTIGNQHQDDISVSFSDKDEAIATAIVTPSMTGTRKTFYVVVKNATAGNRSYSVNFTADYV